MSPSTLPLQPSTAAPAPPEPLLSLSAATLRFGGLTAVNALDLTIRPGELCGLIGPNGAGKTSVFNLITGVYRPTEGRIRFFPLNPTHGSSTHDLAALRPPQIAALGIARTFQNIRLFPSLSVLDHVRVAAALHRDSTAVSALFRTARFRTDEAAITRRAEELLDLFNLLRFRDTPARCLPYGEQRRLEIVRALATLPQLLLLDEPAAGMNPAEKAALVALIRRIHREFHLTILLVEHSMKVVMGACERIAVLDHGVKIAEGPPAEIQNNPQVIEAYLGENHQTSTAHH